MQLLRSGEINSGTVVGVNANPFDGHKYVHFSLPPVVKSLGLLWSNRHTHTHKA